MGYAKVEDVRAIVDTDMEDHEINDLIDESDAFIDLMVVGAGAIVLRAVSRTWTAYKVMRKDPASQRIGPYSEDRAENLKLLKAEYEDLLAAAEAAGGVTLVVGKAPIEY